MPTRTEGKDVQECKCMFNAHSRKQSPATKLLQLEAKGIFLVYLHFLLCLLRVEISMLQHQSCIICVGSLLLDDVEIINVLICVASVKCLCSLEK